MNERYEGDVERVTHVSITRVFEVECPDIACQRVIAVEATYAAAVMARREHFFEVHKVKPGEVR